MIEPGCPFITGVFPAALMVALARLCELKRMHPVKWSGTGQKREVIILEKSLPEFP